ncbi:hypothetical protein [Tenacibaculum ovolyticum]|uniref:hypothetical protein n=1 Tax=Tenacibaculum ovolyticum TaxID=104270 RepID=UPI003BA904D0
MNDLKNLTRSLGVFMEDLWIPFSDSIGIIQGEVKTGVISFPELRNEFEYCIHKTDFNWLQLAKDTQLLIEPNNYSNVEICNYVKWLLYDYIFPDKILKNNYIVKLSQEVIKILEERFEPNDWVSSYTIYDILILKSDFNNLEYYNFWKIEFGKIIELKQVKGKEREIGFLKRRITQVDDINSSNFEESKIILKHNSESENYFTLQIENAPQNVFAIDSIESEENKMFSKGDWIFILFGGYSGPDLKLLHEFMEIVGNYPKLNFAFKPYMDDDKMQTFTSVNIHRKVPPVILHKNENKTTLVCNRLKSKEKIKELLDEI